MAKRKFLISIFIHLTQDLKYKLLTCHINVKFKSNNLINKFFNMEYLSITLLSILCYWPGVFAQEFVFDDREAVRFNRFILWTDLRGNNGKMLNEKKVNSLWELWISDFWGNLSRSNTSHKSYRPLTTITFM